MTNLRSNQLISNMQSFLTAAAQRLYPLVALGDNPASSASDMHGSSPPPAEALHSPEAQLPAAPVHLRSVADCEEYLSSLPGGPTAVVELAARAAAFRADVKRHRIQPELAGPDLRTAVAEVSSALFRTWPRTADAYDSAHLYMACISTTLCVLRSFGSCRSISCTSILEVSLCRAHCSGRARAGERTGTRCA